MSPYAKTLIVLSLVGCLGGARAASFDCGQSHLAADEKAICTHRDLNDADVRMATTFDLLSGLFAMGVRGDMHDEQVRWLKTRRACGSNVACIRGAYALRLQQLRTIYERIDRPI